MRKKELMEKIKKLEEKEDRYSDIIIEQNNTILKLKSENQNLNLDYMALLFKHKKITKAISGQETKNIVYNGKLYAITGVSHYQNAGEVENIVITANNIPEKEGLVNSMGKVFKEGYDSINETLFGNKK